MARDKATLSNIDLSNISVYLNGRIKDSSGSGDGTPVNERVYGDFHQTFAKLMSLGGLVYNNLPDNETNGYQLIEAIKLLASKNDYNYDLSDSSGVLTIALRVGKLKVNEIIRAKASIDKDAQTQITGTLDNQTKTVSFVGDFKANEYVRLINLTNSILIIREADAFNIEALCDELGYLKAASIIETIAGLINDKAVTPESFLNAYVELVNGASSDTYLAVPTSDPSGGQNGLLSKEWAEILENIEAPALRNRGSFILGDIGGVSNGTNLVSTGDITAQVTGTGSGRTNVTVTFQNTMDDTNYKAVIQAESLGSILFDNELKVPPFKKINSSSCEFLFQETANVIQNLKFHIDVIQL